MTDTPKPAHRSPRSAASNQPHSGPQVTDYGLLFLLALMWGASFLLIKTGVDAVPPATLTLWRLVFAAGVIWIALLATGARLPSDGRSWLLAIIVATFGTVLPFNLISWGQAGIETGLTAIIMGVMPLTTMLMAHAALRDDRLTVPKSVAVLFGFAGVLVLVGPDRLTSLGDDVLRQLAIAFAAICYGASAVITRLLMGQASQIGLATAIMTIALAIMVPITFAVDGTPSLDIAPVPLAAIACLGIVQTGLAQIILFKLVARQGASFFSQINFLVPLLGVAWGAAVLGEVLPVTAFVALGLILTGLAISRLRIG